MERSFYNDDFEELIKQKSDQYKIYPSDKVWKGINGSLHSTRKWYWLSFVLFIAGISYFTIDQLSSPVRKIASNKSNAPVPASTTNNEAIILPFTPPTTVGYVKEKTAPDFHHKGLVVAMTELVVANEPVSTPNPFAEMVTRDDENGSVFFPNQNPPVVTADKNIAQTKIHDNDKEHVNLVFDERGNDLQELADNKVTGFDDNLVANNNELSDQKRINWLQENAVYELTRPKLKRTSWQITASPTMNYRKLTGNKDANLASDVKNIPIALNIEGDVENLVNHKPALGLELAAMFLYAVNKNVTFKTGVQFNYSSYNIHAYSSYSSEIATIALNNFYGGNVDSMTNYTRLNNFGGDVVKDIKNEYYQFSAPIGVDLLVLGRGKLQLYVGGTIQPTYLINRDKYLITTDYKNYTRQPSLVRRWNANTSAEAFVSYKLAGFRFQLGPQLRYQLFSSYADEYPVKEFLTEYAIKLGISRTIR